MDIPLFPGMNPYIEGPHRWPEIHRSLVSAIATTLNASIAPTYRATVEEKTYEVLAPTRHEIAESYLVIRALSDPKTDQKTDQKTVTEIEILSPVSKRLAEAREVYLNKRETILSSDIHFVEIDFLRQGGSMPTADCQLSDYLILVSRANQRPKMTPYAFNLRDAIPSISVPLQPEDKAVEPTLDLKSLLDQVCESTGIERTIDYSVQPEPPVSAAEFEWIRSLPTRKQARPV